MIHRWRTAEALLHVLKSLSMPGIKISTKPLPEAFPWITVRDEFSVEHFRESITELLLSFPPRELDWLKGHPKQSAIREVISKPGKTLEGFILPEDYMNDILALRGLIAHDILIHCLSKRHRVDFGINPGGRKLLAVPYRGADTPSLRSEFSHPDCAIVLTLISYYDLGLQKPQLKRTFELLLMKGKEAKKTIYSEWLQLSQIRMKQDDLQLVNNVDKIDLTNESQFALLLEHFRGNYRTVNFWLNSCVFQQELDFYSHNLVGNSWHLVSNKKGRVVGFSGTNDNHKILPLQVEQYLPWKNPSKMWSQLLSTNGMMLDLIIKKTKECRVLPGGDPDGKQSDGFIDRSRDCSAMPTGKLNQALLSFIKSSVNKKVQFHALIDVGALLAGRSNREVAETILKEYLFRDGSPNPLQGITFFDTSTNQWSILERTGRCLQKDQSPLKEKDTFAIFDEPRCRGVDLKLRNDAVAILTLGEDLCKDKFMQAAGRMRQLHNQQSIFIVGEEKLFEAIRRQQNRKDIDSACVLQWVLQNTVRSIKKGLEAWIDQGMFYETEEQPRHALLEDKQDLKSFYEKTTREIPLLSLGHSLSKFHRNRTGKATNFETSRMKKIVSRCRVLGQGYIVHHSGMDEECERELQRETEEEEEEEMEFAKMSPEQEADWNFQSIFGSKSCKKIEVPVTPLKNVISTLLPNQNLSAIGWSDQIFCTQNFIRTVFISHSIDHENKDNYLGNFLRIPDCLLSFHSGEVLLLSDREGAQILPLFMGNNKLSSEDPCFGHYAFETSFGDKYFLRYGSRRRRPYNIDGRRSCSLKLFNGDTMYPGDQYQTLKQMLRLSTRQSNTPSTSILSLKGVKVVASGEPEELVASRGKLNAYDMSDLERMSKEISCEE